MDDDSIDNEENHQVQETEQETAAAKRRRLLRLITVLEKKDTFSLRTRNKTDELVEFFLDSLGDDTHDMLCDNYIEAENYSGLDSDRDTEAEVEATLRFFPEVLTRRTYIDEDDETDGHYPIQFLALARDEDSDWLSNVKAVAFIPLLARLAIELGLFEENERGGLLCAIDLGLLEDYDDERGGLLCEHTEGNNVLHHLMISDKTVLPNQEHHEYIDTKYLQVLIQLRKLGLLSQKDIHLYDLLRKLCNGKTFSTEKEYHYFSENRFKFLVEWDPSALILFDGVQSDRNRMLPIHIAALSSKINIQKLKFVFEYGIRYFPKKKGLSLIFKRNDYGYTPFYFACFPRGEEQVKKMIEDTFIRCYSSLEETPSLNVVEALMTAAIDEDIHLDCVYFLLRRQPDILQKLLSSASITTMAAFNSNNNGISPKKRKRKEQAEGL
jgi:hypothetical protein